MVYAFSCWTPIPCSRRWFWSNEICFSPLTSYFYSHCNFSGSWWLNSNIILNILQKTKVMFPKTHIDIYKHTSMHKFAFIFQVWRHCWSLIWFKQTATWSPVCLFFTHLAYSLCLQLHSSTSRFAFSSLLCDAFVPLPSWGVTPLIGISIKVRGRCRGVFLKVHSAVRGETALIPCCCCCCGFLSLWKAVPLWFLFYDQIFVHTFWHLKFTFSLPVCWFLFLIFLWCDLKRLQLERIKLI